jgi:hypothetical protein
MGTRKRLFYFILLNIFVSALTTWIVATILLGNYNPPADTAGTGLAQSDDLGDADAEAGQPAAGDDSGSSEGSVSVAVGQLEIDTVIGAGDLQSERVLVRHVGDQEVLLVGWQLRDEDGNVYNFPALTMFSGGAVTVHTKVGDSNVVDLYWGLSEPVWTEGETVSLVDPNGDVQAVFEVP